MNADIKTQLVAINLDAERIYKRLPNRLDFLFRNESTGDYTTLGAITTGWTLDEVIAETFGGSVPEQQVRMTWRAGLDEWAQQCTAVQVGVTIYEKRAVDPAEGSPAVIRLRCQPITGYASYKNGG